MSENTPVSTPQIGPINPTIEATQIQNGLTPPVAKKPTILFMSDSPLLHTGQAVVMREIALGLHKTGKYNIVVAGWGFNGYPHNYPFTILPASARDFGKNGHPEAGIYGLEKIIEMVQPQVLWTVADIWMVNYINDLPNRNKFKWVAYTPVDGTPVPKYWFDWLNKVDQVVCETQYGVDEMLLAEPNHKNPRFIYHGCNIESFKPLTVEDKIKNRGLVNYASVKDMHNLELKKGLPVDDFIVGVVARNQPRKNFDKIIKGFSIFARGRSDVKLWCHSAPVDQAYNIPQLADMYGLKNKVLFTPNYNIGNGLSETDLNIVMNLFDVHLLPTQGEGFGIPILETMAAGVPQIVTDFSSQVEFAKHGGELIPVHFPDDFITGIPHPVERAIPRATEIAKILEKLYTDKEYRLELGKKARVQAEKMTWAVTIPQWEDVMDGLINPVLAKPGQAVKSSSLNLLEV